MCGIAGLYNPHRELVDWDAVFNLWKGIADRGRQASGMAWVDGEKGNWKIKVMKSARSPTEMEAFMGDVARKSKRPILIIMHTRFATQGSTTDNRNNHPVLSGDVVLTHNGVIWNDEEVFEALGKVAEYDVDTEAIAAGLDKKGILWVSEEIMGSMSLSWFTKSNPSKLNLFTNGQNPLVFTRLEPDNGMILYASCSWHLEESGFPILQAIHAIPYVHYYTRDGNLMKSNLESWQTDNDIIPPQNPIRYGKKKRIF